MTIKAFFCTDGSCRPTNPGYSGYGVFGYTYKETERSKNIKHPIHPSLYFTTLGLKKEKDEKNLEIIKIVEVIKAINNPTSTNNEAELHAFITALEKASKIDDLSSLTIHTDSNYIVTSFNENINKWKVNNWRRQDNKQIVHYKDWLIIDHYKEKFASTGIDVTVNWVKGHADDYCNNLADIYSVVGSNSARRQFINNLDFNTDILDIELSYQDYKKSFLSKDIIFSFRDLYFSSDKLDDTNYCFLSTSENPNTIGKRDTSSIFVNNIGYVPPIVNNLKELYRKIERSYTTTCCLKLSKLDNKDLYRLTNYINLEDMLVKYIINGKVVYNVINDNNPFIFENGMEYPFIISAANLFDRMAYIDSILDKPDNNLIIKDVTSIFIENNKLKISNKDKILDLTDTFSEGVLLRQKLLLNIGYDIPNYLALKNIEDSIANIFVILQYKQDSNFCTLYSLLKLKDRDMYCVNIENKFLKNGLVIKKAT